MGQQVILQRTPVALITLARIEDPDLCLACCAELINRKAGTVARQLHLNLVTNDQVPREKSDVALWMFARLHEWDELILAAELGEIRGESLEITLDVFVEMSESYRALPIVRRMAMEAPAWSEKRSQRFSYWASRNERLAASLLLELESSHGKNLVKFRQVFGQSDG